VTGGPVDPRRLAAVLAAAARAPGGAWLAPVAAALAEAAVVPAAEGPALVAGGRRLGRIGPCGSVVLDDAGSAGARGPRRVLELDPAGAVLQVVHRRAGTLAAAAVRAGGGWTGLLPGGGDHPLWGASDRVVRPAPGPGGPDAPPSLAALEAGRPLTVAGRVDWDAVGWVPPLAAPAAVPPGAGSALLRLLAGLARDQGVARLRYRGPFPTEQLFWSLTEAFHVADPAPDVAARFTRGAEEAFVTGQAVEPPVDWEPAPRERRLVAPDLAVELRDGVEKVTWEGRSYHRPDWCRGRPDLRRPGHRVVRPVAGPGGERRFVAGLAALDRPVADHLLLTGDGRLLGPPGPGPAAAPPGEARPLDPRWRDALGAALPLDATPLLGPALAAAWPSLEVAWAPVPRDLVAVAGPAIRLDPLLAATYRQAHREAPDAAARRGLARRLVREVLQLVGPAARDAAAAWLAAEPPGRQAAHLAAAGRADRARLAAGAAVAVGTLVDALLAGEALPS
jgi:hypothetical protein